MHKNPKYIRSKEADVIEAWVKNGGVLVLMGNDTGNAEFDHLNILANRFGITFEKGSVGGCPLKVTSPAKPILKKGRNILMATDEVSYSDISYS